MLEIQYNMGLSIDVKRDALSKIARINHSLSSVYL